MSSYSFSDAAVQDLDDICNYIAQSDARAASLFFDRLRQKCKLVADFPKMGRAYQKLASGLRGFIDE